MPQNDDPFFTSTDSDRTIIRPVPGGRKQDIIRQQQEAVFNPALATASLENLGKLNPLQNAATSLLALISKLYNSPTHSNPQQLKQHLVQEVKAFSIDAEKAGYDSQTVSDARYALCTTIDEAIFNTPWGRSSGWGEQSLLSTFHDDVSGGDTFFRKLKELGQNPSKHLHLLELKYLCMALGFQGRYRVVDSGKEKLAQIREWLALLIRKQKGSSETLLSPHWHGIAVAQKTLMRTIPSWVFFAVAAGILSLIFMGFWGGLSAKAEPVKQQISQIVIPEAPLIPKVNELQTLRELLASEIRDELVDVREENGRNLIELRGDQELFKSARETLAVKRKPTVEKIANIFVTPPFDRYGIHINGYTDHKPFKSARFGGNVGLSKARATTIKKLLIENEANLARRISIKGMGPSKKYTTSLSRNRRIEIILK